MSLSTNTSTIFGLPEQQWKSNLGLLVREEHFGGPKRYERLLSIALNAGMQRLAASWPTDDASPTPPVWMAALGPSNLSTEERRSTLIEKIVLLAKLMQEDITDKKLKVLAGLEYWVECFFSKDVNIGHLAAFLHAHDGSELAKTKRIKKTEIQALVLAAFFGQNENVMSTFHAYATLRDNQVPSELIPHLALRFVPRSEPMPPNHMVLHEDLQRLCWVDFDILEDRLKSFQPPPTKSLEAPAEATPDLVSPSGSPISSSTEISEEVIRCVSYFGERMNALLVAAALRNQDEASFLHDFEESVKKADAFIQQQRLSKASSSAPQDTPSPRSSNPTEDLNLESFLRTLRSIMKDSADPMLLTAEGLAFHSSITETMVNAYFRASKEHDAQPIMQDFHRAWTAMRNGKKPSMDTAADAARLGKKFTLANFILYELAGAGGNAQAFRAYMCPDFLPKELWPYLRFVLRFELIGTSNLDHFLKYFGRGCLIAALLDSHKNICPTYTFFSFPVIVNEESQVCFVTVMPNCDESLEDAREHLLKSRGKKKISFQEMEIYRNAVSDILDGLEFMHGRGIIHRDFKTANVLVVKDSQGKWTCKISDLSDAREHLGQKATTGSETGTEAFRCVERQLNRPYDCRTDLFGLGVMIFEFITGVLPETSMPTGYNSCQEYVLSCFEPNFTTSKKQKKIMQRWVDLCAGLLEYDCDRRITIDRAKEMVQVLLQD